MLYSSMTCWWRKKEVHTINQRRACKPIKYWGIYTHIHTRYKRHASAHACMYHVWIHHYANIWSYGRIILYLNQLRQQTSCQVASSQVPSIWPIATTTRKQAESRNKSSKPDSKQARPTTRPRSPSTQKQFKRKEHTTSTNNSDTISNYGDQLLGWTAHRSTTRLWWSTTLPWTKLSDALIFYIPDIIRMPLWPYHLPLTAVNFLG